MLNKERSNELFHYDHETGNLIRKISRGPNAEKGRVAGNKHCCGYIVVRVDNVSVMAHRVIWTMLYGNIDDGLFIDHINGVRDDNRICNLRLVTKQQNSINRRDYISPKKKSKYRGVAVRTRKNGNVKYYSVLINKSVRYPLGSYDNELDAYKAYLIKCNELHGEHMEESLRRDYLKYIISGEN